MKKWIAIGLIGALSVGLAAAQEKEVPWYKKMFRQGATEQNAPAKHDGKPDRQRTHQGDEERGRMMPRDSQQMEKMKAQHEELRKLGEAARNETNPAEKEKRIDELRKKLTAVTDQILTEQKKRLDKAEKELIKQKARLAEAEQNKATRVEEQLQRILAGERIGRPEGKAKGPAESDGRQRKKAPPSGAE